MPDQRILFVIYEYPPLGGGVATAAKHLLQEFAKEENLTVDVITSSLKNSWQTESIYPNITIHKIPIGNKSDQAHTQTPLNMLLFTINTIRKIGVLTKNQKYDLAHYFGYPGAMPGLIFKNNMPYVVSLRGVDVPGYNQKFTRYYQIYKPVIKRAWTHAAAINTNSNWLKSLAQQTLPNAKIAVIPNGVDTELFKPLPETKKHSTFTITAGGTLMNPKKNLNILIDAFALFHQQHSNTQLILFGSGPLETKLKQLVKDVNIQRSVTFTEKVSHDKLAEQLPKCHLFCLPSSAEGMSNAMLEAAASGLPLISTNVGDAADIINDNGYILEKPDPTDLARAITKIYNDKKTRIQMGETSRQKAEKMSWHTTALQYIKQYRKAIE